MKTPAKSQNTQKQLIKQFLLWIIMTIQTNTLDYHENIRDYINIEKLASYIPTVSPYDNRTWDIGYREYAEQIIKKNFVLNDEMLKTFTERTSELNLEKTMGLKRKVK